METTANEYRIINENNNWGQNRVLMVNAGRFWQEVKRSCYKKIVEKAMEKGSKLEGIYNEVIVENQYRLYPIK